MHWSMEFWSVTCPPCVVLRPTPLQVCRNVQSPILSLSFCDVSRDLAVLIVLHGCGIVKYSGLLSRGFLGAFSVFLRFKTFSVVPASPPLSLVTVAVGPAPCVTPSTHDHRADRMQCTGIPGPCPMPCMAVVYGTFPETACIPDMHRVRGRMRARQGDHLPPMMSKRVDVECSAPPMQRGPNRA